MPRTLRRAWDGTPSSPARSAREISSPCAVSCHAFRLPTPAERFATSCSASRHASSFEICDSCATPIAAAVSRSLACERSAKNSTHRRARCAFGLLSTAGIATFARSSTAPVEIVGTIVLERLYDVFAILVIFFAAEPWLPHVSWFGAAALAAIVLAVLIAAAAIVLAVYGDRSVRLLLRPLGRFSLFSGERLERTIDELTHGLSGLRHPGLALEAFAWTIAAWLLTALCSYFVTVAFHLHLPLACGVLVAVAVGLGMILPSPPAAVGVFEGAALIALGAYGIPHSSALPYAVILHLVNFVPFVAVGAFLLHYNSRHPPHNTPVKALTPAPSR
jgi:uncharacterized membrane protein YbhN (UPF0104 family)